MSEFDVQRRAYTRACRAVLETLRSDATAEAAFPAYSHRNPVINHLFWMRIRTVVDYLEARTGRYEAVLDFGCGGGVMAPFLSRRAQRVVAADTNLGPLRAITPHLPLPGNVEVVDLNTKPLEAFPEASFDVILALDVLEHVPDLDRTAARLAVMLAPGGSMIVTGPTENTVYRIGRRLAGPEYTGSYHVTDIDAIRVVLSRYGQVRCLRTLYPLLPLFRVFVLTPSCPEGSPAQMA